MGNKRGSEHPSLKQWYYMHVYHLHRVNEQYFTIPCSSPCPPLSRFSIQNETTGLLAPQFNFLGMKIGFPQDRTPIRHV